MSTGSTLFDHQLFRISRRDAVHMDPQHRLAIEAVWQALEDAAIAPAGTAGKAVGVFFGQQVNAYAGLIETEEGARSQLALGNIASMLPGRISFALDWHGPSEAIDTACSSGLVAVHHAVRALREGECELAVAGAVSLILDPEDVRTTGQLGVLSPDGRCHSFDARANGYVKGEGVGVVVLKPLDRALADGDPIHAVIRGSAVNHGGRAHSLTAPNAQAQRRLVETALADAGLPACRHRLHRGARHRHRAGRSGRDRGAGGGVRRGRRARKLRHRHGEGQYRPSGAGGRHRRAF